MWFFWFLACCLTARPDDHGRKAIKKRVKKYSLEDLRRELEALRVDIDKDMDGRRKRTKKELQKLLIQELRRLELDQTSKGTYTKSTRTAEGFTLPIDIPNDVKMVLADLDENLDKELAEMEDNEKTEDDVKFVINTHLSEVDKKLDEKAEESLPKVSSTLALTVLKEEGEMESMLTQEVGDWEGKAEQKERCWGSGEDKIRAYGSVARRRCQRERHSSRRHSL